MQLNDAKALSVVSRFTILPALQLCPLDEGSCDILHVSPSCHQVISAQQLPKVNNKKSSIVDPLVKVQVFGVPADVAEKETPAIENNGKKAEADIGYACV